MNHFEYVVHTNKLKTLKTKKAIDEYIRELYKQLDPFTPRWGNLKVENVPAIEKLYKLITAAYIKYDKEQLPNFITDRVTYVEKELLRIYTTIDVCTYEKFIDTFQYCTEINASSMNSQQLTTLACIFKDNPLPFSIEPYFTGENTFYSLGIDTRAINSTVVAKILAIENIKQNLDPSILYTILEVELDKWYSHTAAHTLEAQHEERSKAMDALLVFTKDIVKVVETYAAKLKNYG